MRKVRVVISIDGGGIRGLLPIRILEFLEESLKNRGGRSLFERVDLVAGTSTGAIISAALILEDEHGNPKYTPSDLITLYRHRGRQIFSKERTNNVTPLQIVLEANFGSYSIQDLKKQFAFVCYDEELDTGFVFYNELKVYRNVKLSTILLASSAIAPYFEPVGLGKKWLSDGMRAAKNPAEISLNFAKCYFPDDLIVLISLGTGRLNLDDPIEEAVKHVEENLSLESKQNPNFLYYRFNPAIQKASIAMDDTSDENIEHLIHDADVFIQNEKAALLEALKSILRS